MPIDTAVHPMYNRLAPQWEACQDAFDGEWAVKAKPAQYAQRPEGMDTAQFHAYVQRGKWNGATTRTVALYVGAVQRKPPQIAIPALLEPQTEDIDLTGKNLDAFLEEMLRHIFLLGRVGILVDFNREDPAVPRPFLSLWHPLNIRWWQYAKIAGAQRLVRAILREPTYEVDPRDPYALVPVCLWHEHRLNAEGVYEVQTFQNDAQGNIVALTDPVVPEREGEALDFVPLYTLSHLGMDHEVRQPPLQTLVDTNFAYWRHSLDYEHGLRLTALPTGIITGHLDTELSVAIGSQIVLVLPEADAKAYFWEFQGAGLTTHRDKLQEDREEMAAIGARLLESRPDVQETARAVELRMAGEHSALAGWVTQIAQAFQHVLRVYAWWAGTTETPNDPNVTFDLNTDFVSATLSAQDIVALLQLYQGGGMSLDTLLWNLHQGERLRRGLTIEEEKALIAADQAEKQRRQEAVVVPAAESPPLFVRN